jgi:phasin family protein
MENYLNNPMMNMFRKAMENPMDMWSMNHWTQLAENMQSSDMYKGFNPGNWLAMSGKLMENMPWLNNTKQMFNFSENMKNVESYAQVHKISLESAQALLRRQAEVIQKHSTDIYKLMQNLVSSRNPEIAMQLQSEYVQMAFDALVADFKELAEMFSKSHIEHFEVLSNKVGEQIKNMGNKANCEDQQCSEGESKKNNKK